MSRLVVDSWAWVEYLRGSKTGRKVQESVSGKDELWTSVVSLAEVVSKYRRAGTDEAIAVEAISSLSKFGIPDRQDAIEAGELHAETKSKSPNFGLADSFVLQLARKLKGRVLTGDPDFKGIRDVEYVGNA